MNLYARLAGPHFSGTPTVLSKPILTQNTSCYPAWYSVGRYIELDVMTANTANLDFHSWDANTSSAVNYDGRIQCFSGGGIGAGEMNFYGSKFTFYAPLFMSIDGVSLPVTTVNDLWTYAPLTDAVFNNTPLVNVKGVLSEMALKSDLTPICNVGQSRSHRNSNTQW